MKKIFLTLGVMGLFAFIPTASAAAIVVNEAIDDLLHVNGDCSLREAIEAANTNAAVDGCAAGDPDGVATDVIGFDVSTDVGNNGPLTLSIPLVGEDVNAGGDLDVTSSIRFFGNGSSLTVVDGGGIDRVFHILSTSGISVEFLSMQITNGDPGAGDGGGILVGVTSTVTIDDSIITGNTTTGDGGGIFSNFADVDITDSSIDNNSATDGGGIGVGNALASVVTIDNTDVTNNVAGGDGGGVLVDNDFTAQNGSTVNSNDANDQGGGIHVSGSNANVTIDNSTVSMNDALTLQGGGIYNNVGTVTIQNASNLVGNTTPSLGGGIYNNNGILMITDSTLSGNDATLGGGGLINISALSTATITRSTISGNTTNVNGGGVRNSNDADLMLENSTISGNMASGDGGGIYSSGIGTPSMTIDSTTIANNTGTDAVYADAGTVSIQNTILDNTDNCDVGGGTISSLGYNVTFGADDCFALPGPASDQYGVDPLLGVLSINAPGSTATHALLAGSPAIDAGDTTFTTDQRGFARPQGVSDDVGSYEFDSAPVLMEVTPVPSPTDDNTPDWTFNSTEAGTIAYFGDCSSTTTAAVVGNNTITFNALSKGTHNNCSITVTDGLANESAPLVITGFIVGTSSSGGGGGAGGSLSPPPKQQQSPTQPTEPENCGGYSDVDADDQDCVAIEYVQSIDAMTGNDDGTFGPNDFVQRDQMTKIVLEAWDQFDPSMDYCGGVNPFPDVMADDWSYQYVCRAKELQIVTGYLAGPDAGLFKPANNFILVEFWAFMLRNLDVTMEAGFSFAGFETDAWYSPYAKFVADNDLYDGASPMPTDLVPRRDVANFLYDLHLMGEL